MGKRLIESLRVKLTNEERLAKSDELARVMYQQEQLEAKKAEMAKELGEEIKELKSQASRLAYDVRDGSEERQVECFLRPRYRENLVDVMRLDTGETIRSRTMDAGERQQALSLEPEQLEPFEESEESEEPNQH